MSDHNEAMRLADALAQPGVRYATETEAQAKLRRIKNQAEAAALIRKQAERIAELELQPAFAQLASDLAVKLADTKAERDTLRAEVERLRTPLTDEQIDALLPKPDGSAEADVIRVEVCPGVWGKEYDEVDAWSKTLVRQVVRAIDTARKVAP